MIDAVPTCFGIKTRLGMSGRVYFNVFNKIFFLQNIPIGRMDRFRYQQPLTKIALTALAGCAERCDCIVICNALTTLVGSARL